MPGTFTRFTVADPATNQAIQDIYNKLNQIEAALNSEPAASPSTTSTQANVNVPALMAIPNANPKVGTPYTTDGNVIEFTPNATKRGLLYRYNLANSVWAGPLLGGVLTDTHANRVNYAPAAYPQTLFRESDRNVVYFSDGTNWLYLAGAMVAVIASRPTLTTTDAGFQFIASDTLQLSYWAGAAWHDVA